MSMAEDMTAQERKDHPIFTGVLKYFPNALLEVAHLSKVGNDQHNPGEPLHWAMEKSTDEGDALVRHQLDAGTRDKDGERHSAKVAWRALAQLEREILKEKADKMAVKFATQRAMRQKDDLNSEFMGTSQSPVQFDPRKHSLSDLMMKENPQPAVPAARSGG